MYFRYTDLFKTHMEYMERGKMVNSERMEAGSARNKLPNMSTPSDNKLCIISPKNYL